MFASGPMGLTALCLFQAGAQMEAGARAEAIVGKLIYGTSVMLAATPSLRLDWFAGPDNLHADLSTRVLWRPVPLPQNRPLFLQNFGVAHTTRPTSRTLWRFDLSASYGEQDYTTLSRQFATQPTLPLAATMLMVSGAGEAAWRSSRRTTLSIRLGATYRRSWTDQGKTEQQPVGVSLLPTQTMVTASPEMSHSLSRRWAASLSAPTSVYDVAATGPSQGATGPSQGVTGPSQGSKVIYSVQPQINLVGRLSPRDRILMAAGFSYADIARGTATDLGLHVSPLALIGVDSDLYRSRLTTVRSQVSASTSWYLDPVVGQGIWRGTSQAGLDCQVGPRWSAGQGVSLSANLIRPSSSNTTEGTRISSTVYVRYRWTNAFLVELGGTYSESGSYLTESEFAWRNREMWGFLTLYTASRMGLTSARPFSSLSGSGI